MSKLRAEITYNHRRYNTPLSTEPTINIDDANQGSGNLDNINDPVDNLVLTEEESDEEVDEPQLENEFGEYLQDWIEMLEEEKNAEFDEDSDQNGEDSNTVDVQDVSHPAIDANAKWALETLFKDNINSPF